MSVSVQSKARGVVAQHPADRFDVHAILEGQGGEGVAEIVEADVGQARPVQHPAEHMQNAVRGHGAARGGREDPGAVPGFPFLFL